MASTRAAPTCAPAPRNFPSCTPGHSGAPSFIVKLEGIRMANTAVSSSEMRCSARVRPPAAAGRGGGSGGQKGGRAPRRGGSASGGRRAAGRCSGRGWPRCGRLASICRCIIRPREQPATRARRGKATDPMSPSERAPGPYSPHLKHRWLPVRVVPRARRPPPVQPSVSRGGRRQTQAARRANWRAQANNSQQICAPGESGLCAPV